MLPVKRGGGGIKQEVSMLASSILKLFETWKGCITMLDEAIVVPEITTCHKVEELV